MLLLLYTAHMLCNLWRSASVMMKKEEEKEEVENDAAINKRWRNHTIVKI